MLITEGPQFKNSSQYLAKNQFFSQKLTEFIEINSVSILKTNKSDKIAYLTLQEI